MKSSDVTIEGSWRKMLAAEFEKPYFDHLKQALSKDKKAGYRIFPPGAKVFYAFDLVPFDKVKVVILGQDPYHRPGQAMGLSFSVPREVRIPPSLVNIFKEQVRDVGISMPDHGDLTYWAEQGVFLLNAMLTVREGSAGSHKNIGWQQFTDAVIQKISDEREGVIFLLWGRFAQSKKILIDERKHHVLLAAHPSPLARNAFVDCKHFSKTNSLLTEMGRAPIDWQV